MIQEGNGKLPLELSLDKRRVGSFSSFRFSVILFAVVISIAVVGTAWGDIRLGAFPWFVPLHMASVFILDAVTAFLLFGQFVYRRMPVYAGLGGAYLFSALASVAFFLTFPSAGPASGGILGGPQSSAWVWEAWHVLFPAMVIVSILGSRFGQGQAIGPSRLGALGLTWIAASVVLGAVVLLVTALGHDGLPVLIDVTRRPPPTAVFYWVGVVAGVVTLVALALALDGYRKDGGAMLMMWLALALTASVGDIIANHLADSRFSVGWYMGRVQSLVASSVLLFVFLGEINRLYARLGQAVSDLSLSNQALAERTRALAASNEDLEAFAHLASHDLQAPLRTVSGFAQLLERRLGNGGDETSREYLLQIVGGTRRMAGLVKALLAFSQVENGGNEPEPVHVGQVVEGVLSDLEAEIVAAGAVVQVSPTMPVVTADAGQLSHVFQNLLSNALKFRAPQRPAVIRVDASRSQGGWELVVRDNGIGVPVERQEEVFAPFRRLETPLHVEGSGIGLALVRRIVERHKGRVWLESSPGQGAEVHVFLPD
jgi:signal transduction histidine kinase